MIEIRVDADIRAATRALNDVQRNQIPFAASLAINATAKAVQAALTQETRAKLDRPKPYTLRGTFATRSTKRDLTATVGLKSRREPHAAVSEYLAANVAGGERELKRSELLLRRAGILPAGKQTRPGSGAKLDAFGNMRGSEYVSILSYFRAFGGVAKSGARAGDVSRSAAINRGKKPRRPVELFVVPEGQPGLATGVWRRAGKTIEPVLIFIDAPSYKPRYEFKKVTNEAVRRNFAAEMDKALARALETAR